MNQENKKSFFEGFTFFYGLFMGLIIGVLGSFWSSITYDYAKTQKSFDLLSAFRISTVCLIAVIIAFICASIFFWRKAQKKVFVTSITESNQTVNDKKATTEIGDNNIFTLVKFVDDHQTIIFQDYDMVRGTQFLVFIIVTGIAFATIFGFAIASFTVSFLEIAVGGLTLLAVMFAYYSFIAQIGKKNQLEVRYQRFIQNFGESKFNEESKIIIKALIKLRSEHKEFSLTALYGMHSQMFIKEKLLEKLYN